MREMIVVAVMAAAKTKSLHIELEHLPGSLTKGAAKAEEPVFKSTLGNIPLRQAKRTFEAEYFKNLLGRTGGNMTMASRISKVGRPYLYKKIKEYQIEPDEFRQAG